MTARLTLSVPLRGPCPGVMLGFVLVLASLLAACGVAQTGPRPGAVAWHEKNIVFVASNGWHSSIVIARADLTPSRLPEAQDFPAARYLEFGWGDAEYYPAKDPTIAMALRALFTPTPSVVHVAGLNMEPARFYPDYEVVALGIDDENIARLVDFIDASFDRSGAARVQATGPGLYADSLFYPARGKFYLGNTCNSWTARALVAAGFDIDTSGVASAEGLMAAVRMLAAVRVPGEGE